MPELSAAAAPPPIYDVLIVGAGPAGAACALALGGSGLRVALVDKARFPRDKVCGDAIPSPALKALRRLNPQYADELRALTAAHRTDMACSRLASPAGAEVKVYWQDPAFNSPRLHFDHALLELVRRHTDTIILEDCPIRNVEATPDEVRVLPATGAPLTARLLIGCDGANSVVARQLAPWPLDRARHCAAVRAYYTDVQDTPATTSDFVFLSRHRAGYCWVFPVGGGLFNVGFGMLSEDIAREQVDLKVVLDEVLATHPRLAPRFRRARRQGKVQGFGLPLGGGRRPLTAPRTLLCGDAAALIDPLQGHGIDQAIISGILAAEHARRCCAADDFSPTALAPYAAHVQRRLGRDLARHYWLMRLLARAPWLVEAAFTAAQFAPLRRWLVRLMG